jgi:type II secretory pathway pseudopilin PulG
MSLVEVMIALALLSALTAAIMQGTLSTLDLESLTEAQDDLALEAQHIQKVIASDLTQSGWYFPVTSEADYATNDITRDRRG